MLMGSHEAECDGLGMWHVGGEQKGVQGFGGETGRKKNTFKT